MIKEDCIIGSMDVVSKQLFRIFVVVVCFFSIQCEKRIV